MMMGGLNNQLFAVLKATLLLALASFRSSLGCGSFISTTTSGVITTPNYPNPYPHNTRCIWVFEAPSLHQVVFNIENFAGQESAASASHSCHDYIEIRNGSSISEIILLTCTTTTSQIVTSSSRWLWVLFSSDGSQANIGLKANYSSVFAGDSVEAIANPLSACKTHEFSCANRQCISNSYRCDDYNDCGCSGGCDEDDCGGMNMPYGARLAMGVGIGVVLFISICMFSLLWERRHNWAKLNHKEKEKEKEKDKTKR